MNARVFGVFVRPVRKFKRFRAEIAPFDDDGIEVFLFREFNDDPRRVFWIENFAPPHSALVAIGKVAATDETVVVFCRAAVNCFAEESRSPTFFAWCPESGAVVFACAIPVVVIAQASVRETENRVTSIDEGGRHVVITRGRIPDGEIGAHHVLFVNDDARMRVVNFDDVLCSQNRRCRKRKCSPAQKFFDPKYHKSSSKIGWGSFFQI